MTPLTLNLTLKPTPPITQAEQEAVDSVRKDLEGTTRAWREPLEALEKEMEASNTNQLR